MKKFEEHQIAQKAKLEKPKETQKPKVQEVQKPKQKQTDANKEEI